MFPKFPFCSPACSLEHLTFIPYALANVVLLGQRGGTIYFKIESSIWGSTHKLIFLSDGPIKLAQCKKKQKQKSLNLGVLSSNLKGEVKERGIIIWK
jgi:hypothetical protein